MASCGDGSYLCEYEESAILPEVLEDPYSSLVRFPSDTLTIKKIHEHSIYQSTPKINPLDNHVFVDSVRALCDPYVSVEHKHKHTEQPQYYQPITEEEVDKSYGTWIQQEKLRKQTEVAVQDVDGFAVVTMSSPESSPQESRDHMYRRLSMKIIDDYPSQAIVSNEDDQLRFNFMKMHRGVTKINWGDMRSFNERNSFRDRIESKVALTCKSIIARPADLQPLFFTMAIYDIQSKTRVTETFYFHQNPAMLTSMLAEPNGAELENLFWKSTPNTAIIQLPSVAYGLYVVVRVEKVLQGEYESCIEPYTKDGGSVSERAKREIKDLCARLGEYRQPLGWGAIPLFNEENIDARSEVLCETSKDMQLYKYRSDDVSDSAILEGLSDKTSKKKPINISLTISVTKFEESFDISRFCVIDPCESIVSYPGSLFGGAEEKLRSNTLSPATVAVELQTFSGRGSAIPITPYNRFVNNYYIYPEHLSFANVTSKSCQARTLMVTVSCKADDSNFDDDGLPVFYSRNGLAKVSKASSQIVYHNKTPNLADEMKMELPDRIDVNRHLLFKFYHVSCKELSKGSPPKSEATLLGFSFLKLFSSSSPNQPVRLSDDFIHTLQVYNPPTNPTRYIRTCEDSRPDSRVNFKVRTRTVSSLYIQEDSTFSLVSHYQSATPEVLRKILEGLYKQEGSKDLHEAFRFLPWIFDTLLKLLLSPSIDVAIDSFKALQRLISRVSPDKDELNPWILSYAKYLLTIECDYDLLCERILRIWMDSGIPSTPSEKKTGNDENFTFFMFNILSKAMAVHLATKGLLENCNEWNKRPLSRHLKSISNLVVKVLERVIARYTDKGETESRLNRYLAYFLSDLLSLTDRGHVMNMVHYVLQQYHSLAKSEIGWKLRIEFTRIVFDHEHFVQLSLPIAVRIESIPNMLETFEKKHYMCGLLLNEVKMSFQAPKAQKYEVMRTLVWIMVKIETDPRYQGSAEKSRIAAMFFPYLSFIVDKAPEFWRISHGKATGAQDEGRDMDNAKEYYRNVLICFLWILKHASTGLLKEWWKKENSLTLVEFLGLLDACLGQFTYLAKSDFVAKQNLAEIEQMYMPQSIRKTQGSLRGARERTSSLSVVENTRRLRGSVFKPNSETKSMSDVKLEHVISTEIRLVVLEVLDVFSTTFEKDLLNPNMSQLLAGPFLEPLLHMLDVDQSRVTHQTALALLNKLLHQFKRLFFVFKTPFVEKMADKLLLLSCVRDSLTSNLASATVYSMLKLNYEELGHFYRTKYHLLSHFCELSGLRTLRFGGEIPKDEKIFKLLYHEPLGALCENMKAVAELDTTITAQKRAPFLTEVTELLATLKTIIIDVNTLKNATSDRFTRAEMLYRLSDMLSGNPDLKLYLMHYLAELQDQYGDYAEAAVTLVNAACLVAEYMKIHSPSSVFDGASSIASIFPSVRLYASPRDSIPEALINEMILSDAFTEEGLIDIVNQIIPFFDQAQMYEYCSQLSLLLIPCLTRDHKYEVLSATFHKCASYMDRIERGGVASTRLFASYFRVGFYGQAFKANDGVEFIYRCGKSPHLFEFKEQLLAFVTETYGVRNVTVMQDSKTVNRDSLNPNETYIQLTALKPHFGASEKLVRRTAFEKATNIAQFYYESPFTKDGNAQGGILDQYIRKTILSVEHPFPATRSRQVVTSRREHVYTPIEVATDSVMRQVDRITTTLTYVTSNVNELQSLLQGTLLAQVNTGPMAFCEGFLVNGAAGHDFEKAESLRASLRQLLSNLGKGIEIHKAKIGYEHYLLHESLEKAFADMLQNMGPYLQTTGVNAALMATEEAIKSGDLVLAEFPSLSSTISQSLSDTRTLSMSTSYDQRQSFGRRASVNPALLKNG